MNIVLTGSGGSLGKVYMKNYPGTIGVSVRYNRLDELIKVLQDTDVLIHASASLQPKTIHEGVKDNVDLTMQILEEVKKIRRPIHVILISSMSIFGESKKIKKPCDMTKYTLTKWLMEGITKDFMFVPITVVRFSTLFYKDPNKDGLSRMIHTAKTEGKVVAANCKRDFLPLTIACKWLNKLCGNKDFYGKTITLAHGKPINMLDIAKYLKNKYGVSFHHTMLESNSDICYKFSPKAANRLEKVLFNMYDVIDIYYNEIQVDNKKKKEK